MKFAFVEVQGMLKPVRALYLCYFGLREPLVQTQVLPYLRQLIQGGVEVTLLTFEPDKRARWTQEESEGWRNRLLTEGINWFALPYHKRPSLPATLYDIVAGAWLARSLVRRYDIDLLHARSHVAAAMGALVKAATGRRLIFDIRGLLAEEYVDSGRWRAGGFLYRATKAAESLLLEQADGFVVLTNRVRDILFPPSMDSFDRGRPIEVIPCCVDTERFRAGDTYVKEDVKDRLGLTDRRVVVYVGSLGSWYLADEMAEFMVQAHRQDPATFLLVLTQSPSEIITDRLKELGVGDGDYFIRHVNPCEVPFYLRAADIAISFIKPCYSKLSSSPTKVAEYLASGLPVVINAGIGDLDDNIQSAGVGVLLRALNGEAYREALREVERLQQDQDLVRRCHAYAREYFDLDEVGGVRYRRLYSRVLQYDASEIALSKATEQGSVAR
jgi:glycosyltransferase involved in cell wall biosynthesis